MTLPKRFVTSDRGRNNVQINTRGLHRKYLPFSDWGAALRQHLPDRHIASAGIYGLEGCPADDSAGRRPAAWDLPRRSCGAPADTQSDAGSDLIPVMEPEHLRFIAAMAPESRGKSLLLGNGWSRRISPIPTVKAGKRLNMCSGYWVKPAGNGHVV